MNGFPTHNDLGNIQFPRRGTASRRRPAAGPCRKQKQNAEPTLGNQRLPLAQSVSESEGYLASKCAAQQIHWPRNRPADSLSSFFVSMLTG